MPPLKGEGMEAILMSQKERHRLEVMSRVRAGELSLVKAQAWLNLSYRQTKRIWHRYRTQGDRGLVHMLRGRPSGRSKGFEIREAVLEMYRQLYPGFGPTLASEHLARAGYHIDHETLRRWLISAGLWERHRRRPRHRQRRERRAQVGELIQMDGSEHDWFEGRGERAVLMVMIDDASNRTYARFYEGETTMAAMDIFERYVVRYGLPRELYVDQDSIYRVATRHTSISEQMTGRPRPLTQFGRAMESLGVRIVTAFSPQAKGRVERRNGVFQDRLVKEMRLLGIDNISAANDYLENDFLPKLNQRFTLPPANPHDAHQPVPSSTNLAEVLCIEEERTVARDWTVRWQNRCFQILRKNTPLPLPSKKITIRQLRNASVQLLYKGRKLLWREIPNTTPLSPPQQQLRPHVKHKTRIKHKPAPNHPWRIYASAAPTCRFPPTSFITHSQEAASQTALQIQKG